MKKVNKSDVVISSCGKISRELYSVNDRPRNFYVQGSMGSSLGIGIGIAMERPELKVRVIAGDGEILMSLGTLVLMNYLNLKNLHLDILDNNSYQSTGGQKTCSEAVDFTNICESCSVWTISGLEGIVAPRIPISHEEIKTRFMRSLNDKLQ